MYQAELKGKLPSTIGRQEDILTSNVFSFFKYSDRRLYLKSLLDFLHVPAAPDDLQEAEFVFWPNYDDGTQPDLVIIVGRYYLLFEAKYFSGVGEEGESKAGQLIREIRTGRLEAKNVDKDFRLILVTNDTLPPHEILSAIPDEDRISVDWMKWQHIAALLSDLIDSRKHKLSAGPFAKDLYDLLDKKHLRGFLSFKRLAEIVQRECGSTIFFNAITAKYRGAFLGFGSVLSPLAKTRSPAHPVFFSKQYMSGFPNIGRAGETIFFRRTRT